MVMTDRPTLDTIRDTAPHLLAELHRRQGVVRDMIRGVARGYATGCYLYGVPGTAKTHTVRQVLEQEIREPYVYQRGHLTPLGLFELIRDHPEEVIVLDDLVTIFKSDVALQVLLSALEHPTGPDRGRVVKYRRKGETDRVVFRGGLVCITNRQLHDADLLGAFKSRVHVLNYDPSDAQLGALMLSVAAAGTGGDGAVTPREAVAVAEYVIGEMLRVGAKFDLRLYFNKALPDYVQWKDGETESDWRDLVTAAIEEHLVTLRYTDGPPSRAERKDEEHAIVEEIVRDCPSREERLRAWAARTGKSPRAFYRRLAEIR